MKKTTYREYKKLFKEVRVIMVDDAAQLRTAFIVTIRTVSWSTRNYDLILGGRMTGQVACSMHYGGDSGVLRVCL